MKVKILLVLLLSVSFAHAQEKPIKVVFDVTSKDTLVHQAVMRHVSGMAKAYPQSSFEVVIYGGALPMFLKDESVVSNDIKALVNNKNVSFKVCGITMKRHKVEPSQLLPGIVVVPDAIVEIVTKQGEGWGYIKEAHN